MLTLEDIRKAHSTILRETVYVEDWSGDVVVRGMTGRERDEFELSLAAARRDKKPMKDVRARLLVKLIEGADGKLLFTEADAGWLSGGNARPLSACWDVVARLSGLTEEDAKEHEGNSVSGPSAASGSNSAIVTAAP